MSTLFTSNTQSLIIKSEREVLQEQLRNIRNQKKFICSWEAETLRRLAEIERETVERERQEYVPM